MGWSAGSEMATRIFEFVEDALTPSQRKSFAKGLIEIFEDYDCDTMYECDEIQEAARGKKK